jgi:hypothetical protein
MFITLLNRVPQQKNKNKQELLQLGTQNVWQQKNMEIDDN